MAPFDPQKHHRRSMRLKGYNYAQPGAYFITLVTYQRENIFGQIVNGVMQLSALGQIARDEWMRSAGLRREICLNEDEIVIMPNHLHGIVWIVDPSELDDPIDPVGAHGVRPEDVGKRADAVRPYPDGCRGPYHPLWPGSSRQSQAEPGANWLCLASGSAIIMITLFEASVNSRESGIISIPIPSDGRKTN